MQCHLIYICIPIVVQLICTVTPASSNMEETHNTLKFASRAKRVEIYASRNKVCYNLSDDMFCQWQCVIINTKSYL